MEILHGKYLVAAAVFCFVVTLTSSAPVSSITCTQSGNECPTNSACVTTGNTPYKCKCNAAYKEGAGSAENTCVPKAVGDSCTDHGDCSTGDTNSECSTEEQRKCKCKTGFTAVNNVCKRGLGDPCEGDTECNAVSNAECASTEGSKKCACKANYKEENDQCNSANGLQTLLSAPVALLLSFLMIVVTRLH